MDWRRPPGHPRHTWLCTLDADLQPHNLGLNSAWKYAQHRQHWKHLVETLTLQACDDDVENKVAVWLSSNVIGHNQPQSYSTSSWVSTEMGDRSRVYRLGI